MARRKAQIPPKPVGNAVIPIDWKFVDSLIQKGCNGVQIAARLDCHPETLYERCKLENGCHYSDYSYLKRAKGETYLLETQYDLALEGDRTLLIFLGKTRLGQIEARHKDDNTEQLGQLMQLISTLAGKPIELPQTAEKTSDESEPKL